MIEAVFDLIPFAVSSSRFGISQFRSNRGADRFARGPVNLWRTTCVSGRKLLPA